MDEVFTKEFYTKADVMRIWGISAVTLWRWEKEGKFPRGVKQPKGKRWSRTVLQKYIELGQSSDKELKLMGQSMAF